MIYDVDDDEIDAEEEYQRRWAEKKEHWQDKSLKHVAAKLLEVTKDIEKVTRHAAAPFYSKRDVWLRSMKRSSRKPRRGLRTRRHFILILRLLCVPAADPEPITLPECCRSIVPNTSERSSTEHTKRCAPHQRVSCSSANSP